MDIASLLISIAGVVISLWAISTAIDAKKAIELTIKASGHQRERDSLRDLIRVLAAAKDASFGRRQGASPLARAGRSVSSDRHALEVAADRLRSYSTEDDDLARSLFIAANEMDLALQNIASAGPRDAWEDARLVLQGIISQLEKRERFLSAEDLRLKAGQPNG